MTEVATTTVPAGHRDRSRTEPADGSFSRTHITRNLEGCPSPQKCEQDIRSQYDSRGNYESFDHAGYAILEQDYALVGVALAGRPHQSIEVRPSTMNRLGPEDGLAIGRFGHLDELVAVQPPSLQGLARTGSRPASRAWGRTYPTNRDRVRPASGPSKMPDRK